MPSSESPTGDRSRGRVRDALRGNAALRWGLVVLAIALLMGVLDVWWAEHYRAGYPLDIDEAGYTTFGFADYYALHYQGLSGWWEAIQHQPTFAPLLPAVTSLSLHFSLSVLNGFVVLALFSVVLALAAYLLAVRLVGPRPAAFAAFVTATLPGTIAFSREYIFALPTATFLLIAVYAIIRSDGLRKWAWAVGCGVAIGLMMLSRTMAIAYVPGILLAGVVPMFLREGGVSLARRFANLALLLIVAVLVAATWYARNVGSVVEYLTSYGYGHQAKFYGAQHALISWGRFRSVAEHMMSEDLFLPLAAIALVALGALVVAAARRLRPEKGRREALRRIVASDAFGVCLVFIVGYGALMSSRNGGDGFTIPLTVLLPTIGVVALRRFPRATIPTVAVVSIVAIFNVVSTATIWKWAAQGRYTSVPLLAENIPITKGQPKAVFASRIQFPGSEFMFGRRDGLWLRADRKLSGIIETLYGPNGEAPVVAFASRNRMLNSNTMQLAAVQKYQRGVPLEQFEVEEESENNVAHYKEVLNGAEEAAPTALVTMSSEENDYNIAINQKKAEAAARQVGFHRFASMTLPDGRTLWVWRKGD